MSALDPRLHAFRPDLADRRLEGRVAAARFVAGRPARIIAPSAPLRRSPRPDAPLDTEALHGEAVSVFEETAEGWAWLQLEGDRYVGWCPSEALGGSGGPPTHRVAVLRSFVYPGPDIKLAPRAALSRLSTVAVRRVEGPFAVTDHGFLHAGHLEPVDTRAPDFVAVAESFLGVPYLWGGRTSLGLDCSALVQLALLAAGRPCPRDSDMQEADPGFATVADADVAGLARGDLLFWPGHVAIARGDGTLIHASGHHMAVVIENAVEAVERIAASGVALRSLRRPQ